MPQGSILGPYFSLFMLPIFSGTEYSMFAENIALLFACAGDVKESNKHIKNTCQLIAKLLLTKFYTKTKALKFCPVATPISININLNNNTSEPSQTCPLLGI